MTFLTVDQVTSVLNWSFILNRKTDNWSTIYKSTNQHKSQLKCVFKGQSKVEKNETTCQAKWTCVSWRWKEGRDTHRIHQTQNVHFKIRTRDEEKSKLGRPCERLNVELLIQLKLCRTYYLPPQNEIVLVVVNAINLQLVYCSNTSSVCRFTLSGKLKRVFERPLFCNWRKCWPIRTRAAAHTLNRNRTKWRWIKATKPNHWKQSWIMDQARSQRPPKPKVS